MQIIDLSLPIDDTLIETQDAKIGSEIWREDETMVISFCICY